MTRDQQLERIRQKCVEANPEINQKSEYCICGHWVGCHTTAHVISKADLHGRTCRDCTHCICKHFHENVGRPIRLADVLLAMRESFTEAGTMSGISNFDTFVKAIAVVAGGGKSATSWNLRKDDLTEQSDECVAFLYDLLK